MKPEQMKELHFAAGGNTRPWSIKEYRSLINDPIAVHFSGNYGFALGRVVYNEAELLMIIVQANKQELGFGRAYLSGFELASLKRGAKSCFLEVATNNKAAKALYYSSGYKQVGVRSLYYAIDDGQRLDALILKKRLN